MIWAADKTGRATSVIPATTSSIHTKSGMRLSVIPGHRRLSVVAIRLTLVAMVPTPLSRMARFQ